MKNTILMKRFEEFYAHFEQREMDINPLEMFELYFELGHKNWRKLAFEKCLKEKLEFHITDRSISFKVEEMISVKCPSCQSVLTPMMDRYEPDKNRYNCECDCGLKIQLTMPSNSIKIDATRIGT